MIFFIPVSSDTSAGEILLGFICACLLVGLIILVIELKNGIGLKLFLRKRNKENKKDKGE